MIIESEMKEISIRDYSEREKDYFTTYHKSDYITTHNTRLTLCGSSGVNLGFDEVLKSLLFKKHGK